MSKKGKKKKSAQKFFILKYVIKNFKKSNFYYQKVLHSLIFCRDMRAQNF